MKMRLEKHTLAAGFLAGAACFAFDRTVEWINRNDYVALMWLCVTLASLLALGCAAWTVIGWFLGWWGRDHPKSPYHSQSNEPFSDFRDLQRRFPKLESLLDHYESGNGFVTRQGVRRIVAELLVEQESSGVQR